MTNCLHCDQPLPPTARAHARYCSPAHRAAHHRSSIADRLPRVRFPRGATCDKAATVAAYTAVVSDQRYPGMYRLKRTDGSLSDMVNLTRAKDALAVSREAA
jgi:hypothetical protein